MEGWSGVCFFHFKYKLYGMADLSRPHFGSICAGTFLVAGTCIGAGMLALPVATSLQGFFPAIVMMIVCWAFMTLTALLILEVTLWMQEGAHLVTLSGKVLGSWGKAVAWVTYLFIGYASLVAYVAGGGTQISYACFDFFDIIIPKWWGCVIFVVVFGSIVYFSKVIIGRINSILFISLIVSYVGMIWFGGREVDFDLLSRQEWSGKGLLLMTPLMLTAFSFPGIVPSLVPYLHRRVNILRGAIIVGTLITVVIYVIWQGLVLGTVPLEGAHGLAAAFVKGEPATQSIRLAVKSPIVSFIAEYFSFFAMVTSFLGISWSLYDFLADGLNISPAGWKNDLFLVSLIVFPVLFFAISYARAFIVALETTGGFGDAILCGMLPVTMIWVGRYYQNREGPYRVWGGKPLLCGLFVFSVIIFIAECYKLVYENSLY